MPKYNYLLSDIKGDKISGTIFAQSLELAKKKLSRSKKFILEIAEDKHSRLYFWQKPHLSLQEKMTFLKHLSTMIKVGITITEALKILIDQTSKKSVRAMYQSISDMITNGQSLSNSLKEFDYIFSDIFINMIAVGEKSGTLEKTLSYLSIQMEKEYELRKKILSAFIYPVLIVVITLIIAAGIVIFIMPKITKIFKTLNLELPAITQFLIDLSDFISTKPLTAFAILLSVVSFFVFIFTAKFLKPFWENVVLVIPILKKIVINGNLARFNRTLNSLLQSGITVSESLTILSKMTTNRLYKKAITEALEKVQQGGKLGKSLENYPKIFPQLMSKTISIGEKTGSMETTTGYLAELYENNVDTLTKNLSVLLEPLLLLFMAGLVGTIVLAIILPIYKLPSILKR
ncbi:type II secretion system F family protein [Candidatus Peregrinibacteria bacterium]|nr:type II secretion system F family protein [Candidatus Peregrinibacteria bacterium]